MHTKSLIPSWAYMILLIAFVIFVIMPVVELLKGIDFFPKEDRSMVTIYSVGLIILTFFLVIFTAVLARVAWIQLGGIKNTAKADFLMRIDDRYGSEPILKGRNIIQRLYRESNNLHPSAPEEVHRSHIAIRIHEISEDINTAEEYIYLLNLLDFLETISYFANKGAISKLDIQNLMGPSMKFFFSIFTPRIEHRRKKYGNEKYYSELQKLVGKMNKKTASK